MLPESVIEVRKTLANNARPYRLFFDNNQIVNSLTDVISWNDEHKVLHVVRITQDPAIQKNNEVEILTFGYEDIRSFSFFTNTTDMVICMEALQGVGATEFNRDRALKLQKHFMSVLGDQNRSAY